MPIFSTAFAWRTRPYRRKCASRNYSTIWREERKSEKSDLRPILMEELELFDFWTSIGYIVALNASEDIAFLLSKMSDKGALLLKDRKFYATYWIRIISKGGVWYYACMIGNLAGVLQLQCASAVTHLNSGYRASRSDIVLCKGLLRMCEIRVTLEEFIRETTNKQGLPDDFGEPFTWCRSRS